MTLDRYIEAQTNTYPIALKEIKEEEKQSHWMWFIFPQIKGLGYSPTSVYYAIQNREEAEQYLAHPILGARLREISEVLLGLNTSNANQVFGYPDDLKLKSSMTLFYLVGKEALFKQVLDKFFSGELDERTVELLK